MLDEYQQMMREAMKRGDDDDDILDLEFLRVWLDLWGKISSKKEKAEWRDVSLEHFPFFSDVVFLLGSGRSCVTCVLV